MTGTLTSNTGETYGPTGGGLFAGCFDRSSCTLSSLGNDISNNTTAKTLIASGSNIQDVRASGGGVGIIDAVNVSFNGDTIQSNRALSFAGSTQISSSRGGGILLQNVDTAAMNNRCMVENNVAAETADGGNGGGLYLQDVRLTLTGCTVKDNQTVVNGDSGSGGGIWLQAQSFLTSTTISLPVI